MLFDNLTQTWKQGRSQPQPTISITVQAYKVDATSGSLCTQDANVTTAITATALADTGCQSCLAGSNLLRRLGLRHSDLIPVKTKMRAASNDGINLLGAILLKISGIDATGSWLSTNQMTYITNCTDQFFLCREACTDLGLISKKNPTIGDTH